MYNQNNFDLRRSFITMTPIILSSKNTQNSQNQTAMIFVWTRNATFYEL